MADVHLFMGEKGGVGKSFVCATAIDFHTERGLDCVPFDSDRTNPDIMKTYKEKAGARVAVFSESPRHADSANAIINTAVDENRRVLVNTSGNSLTPLLAWMNKSHFVDVMADSGSTFFHWFVCSGGPDSLRMFGESVGRFDERVRHVFVKNFGITEDWEAFDKDKALQKLLKKHKAIVIEFPAFIGNIHRNEIKNLNLSFLEGREREEFGTVGRQRARSFLDAAADAFEQAGVFDVAGE